MLQLTKSQGESTFPPFKKFCRKGGGGHCLTKILMEKQLKAADGSLQDKRLVL